MTTDKELLELAAKAGGYDCVWEGDGDFINQDTKLPWSSLECPDDALELAVKLGISLSLAHDITGDVCAFRAPVRVLESSIPNPLAATCRAITRAATAIQLAKEKV